MRKNERTISIAAQNVHYILEGTVERVPAVQREGQQIIYNHPYTKKRPFHIASVQKWEVLY